MDVTWAPAGVVLMAEQAYSFPLGDTSTGLMLSEVHPATGKYKQAFHRDLRTLEDSDETEILV